MKNYNIYLWCAYGLSLGILGITWYQISVYRKKTQQKLEQWFRLFAE